MQIMLFMLLFLKGLLKVKNVGCEHDDINLARILNNNELECKNYSYVIKANFVIFAVRDFQSKNRYKN